jgi:hypothetical protein
MAISKRNDISFLACHEHRSITKPMDKDVREWHHSLPNEELTIEKRQHTRGFYRAAAAITSRRSLRIRTILCADIVYRIEAVKKRMPTIIYCSHQIIKPTAKEIPPYSSRKLHLQIFAFQFHILCLQLVWQTHLDVHIHISQSRCQSRKLLCRSHVLQSSYHS